MDQEAIRKEVEELRWMARALNDKADRLASKMAEDVSTSSNTRKGKLNDIVSAAVAKRNAHLLKPKYGTTTKTNGGAAVRRV